MAGGDDTGDFGAWESVGAEESGSLSSKFDRLLDPNDYAASISLGPGTLAINPQQILSNITELLERYELNPELPLSLAYIADPRSLGTFLESPFSELGVTHLASEADRILRHRYPDTFPDAVQFDVLDTFDPRKDLNVPSDADVVLEPLDVTRSVMRDYLDPTREPREDYGIGQLGAVEASAVLLGSLLLFGWLSIKCREVAG